MFQCAQWNVQCAQWNVNVSCAVCVWIGETEGMQASTRLLLIYRAIKKLRSVKCCNL